MEHKGESDTNCSLCVQNSSQEPEERTGGIGNQRKNRDYPDYSIAEIGQNTQKSPGDLRRLAVT